MSKPLLAIMLILPLSVSAGEGPDWKKMGECSARYALTLEIIRSFSVDMLAVELADEIDTSEDAFLAGVEYASEKQSVLHSISLICRITASIPIYKKCLLQFRQRSENRPARYIRFGNKINRQNGTDNTYIQP